MTTHELINPDGMAPPVGFSHAVAAHRGRTVYVAGQTATAENGDIDAASFIDQFDGALANVVRALQAAGARPEHVVSLVMYTTAMGEYRAIRKEVGAAYRRHFGRHYPAMALIGVTELVDAAARIEIIATAVIPQDR